MKGLLRFFVNKKTIVLFGIIAGIVVIVGGYYYRTQILTEPIEVLVARDEIRGEDKIQIDESKFIRMKMNSSDLKELNKKSSSMDRTGSLVYEAYEASNLVGKYVKISATIPKGGLFYKDLVVSEEDMPDYIWHGVENNQTIMELDVSDVVTDFNSMKPGQVIQIHASYRDAVGTTIKGCYIGGIKVYGVRDKNMYDVSEKGYDGKPALMLLVVSDHYYQYLTIGPKVGVKFYPVGVGNIEENNSSCDGSTIEEVIKSKLHTNAISEE